MPELFIRNLPEQTKREIKSQAAKYGFSLARYLAKLSNLHQHARQLARSDEAVARLLVELEID